MSAQTHATTKCYLSSILKKEFKEPIAAHIRTVHHLAQHTTFFLKYWLSHFNGLDFPAITKEHIYMAFVLLNKGPSQRLGPASLALQDLLWPFVEGYCSIFNFAHPHLRHDQQTSHYVGDSILTNLRVNVQEHFVRMYLRYINTRLGVKAAIRILKGLPDWKEQVKQYCAHLRRDLLNLSHA
ncbi:hypothetical protein DFS34DRAFT_269531 [Phlyctochytrium arcticum]|nr:hypothetical protein DFS34DRAFT_269531 [Phlyctochytrium arcticum]